MIVPSVQVSGSENNTDYNGFGGRLFRKAVQIINPYGKKDRLTRLTQPIPKAARLISGVTRRYSWLLLKTQKSSLLHVKVFIEPINNQN